MVDSNSSSFDRHGLTLHKNLLPTDLSEVLRLQIDSKFDQIESTVRSGRSANEVIDATERYVPTASSFTIGAAVPQGTVDLLLARIADAPTGRWIKHELENEVVCDLDQSWVRRQYAPAHYPRFHAAHGWHQDGALKFDFTTHPGASFPQDAMLNMVTCWIALDCCGKDAPGLEIIVEKVDSVIPPSELRNEAVRTRFATDKFWRPMLDAGDALLFRGNYLHHTHVAPSMTKDRTSVELRFFAKNRIPQRIKSDRFIELR